MNCCLPMIARLSELLIAPLLMWVGYGSRRTLAGMRGRRPSRSGRCRWRSQTCETERKETYEAEQSATQLYLAAQREGANGFSLQLEGGALRDLPLLLGVGDGRQWRSTQYRPSFVLDRPYQVRAVVSPDRAQLFLDGMLVGEVPGRWQPAAGPLIVNDRPEERAEVGDWLVELRTTVVTLSRGGKEVSRQQFDGSRPRPVALQLFQADDPHSAPLAPWTGDTLTIELSFTFSGYDLHALAPLIDRYGQCREADWPGKVHSDEDLTRDLEEEEARLAAMPPSPDFDSYGGYKKAGWSEEGTGFFRVTKRHGFWWLISPDGNPTFYLGMNSAHRPALTSTPIAGREHLFEWLPDRTGRYAGAWHPNSWQTGEKGDSVSLYECNLIRKYGESYQRRVAEEQTVRRLRSWGFSGGGKWGTPAGLVETPVLGHNGSALVVPVLVRHPDVFDPAVRAALRARLIEQIGPRRNDPLVLGWAVGSEVEEIVQPEEVTSILQMGASVPAKRALLDHALEARYSGSIEKLNRAWGTSAKTREELYGGAPTPPAPDLEAMRLHYADKYYECMYQMVKEVDPNHLYLACYLCPICEEREEDWRLAGRHADIISYDLYVPAPYLSSAEYGNERLRRIEAELDKPTLCGEFSYPAWYDGQRGFGRYRVSARDDGDAGDKYCAWVQGAARDPYSVGGIWFEYLDQPLTGHGSGHSANTVFRGEHFAFGLISQTDRPKWEMVAKMREANLQAAEWRLVAARQR